MHSTNPSRVLLLALTLLAPSLVAATEWKQPASKDLVQLTLTDGEVIIELNERFAPATVQRFRELVRERFYDGAEFYRVIDGFVAQAGDGSDLSTDEASRPGLPAEFAIPWSEGLPWTPVQKPDLFAPETGFVDGFPAARDLEKGQLWLTHCPGVVAMARGTEPDSGATDFYVVIGQAPRYLDRNLTVFGRVLLGMDVVQQVRRGSPQANGIIPNASHRSSIRKARLFTELEAAPRIERVDTGSEDFTRLLEARRKRDNPFFVSPPPPVLDVCQVPLAARYAPLAADPESSATGSTESESSP